MGAPQQPIVLPLDEESSTVGSSGATEQRSWVVLNVGSKAEAIALAETAYPTAIGGVPFDRRKTKFMTDSRGGRAVITVDYANSSSTSGGGDDGPVPDIKETGVSIDISRGGDFVTHSISTRLKKLAEGEQGYDAAPDFKGQMRVVDGVSQGFEVDPQSMAQITFTVDAEVKTSLITNQWLKNIEQNLLLVNSSTYRGRAAGEVCFFGLTGTYQTQEATSPLSWEFGIRRNISNETIGKFSGVTKKGWDYAWVYSEKRVASGGVLFEAPVALYVEQIFFEGSFSGLGV